MTLGSLSDSDAQESTRRLSSALIVEEAREGLLYLRNTGRSPLVVDALRVVDDQGSLLAVKRITPPLVIHPGEVRGLRVAPSPIPPPMLERGARIIVSGPGSPQLAAYDKLEILPVGVGGEYRGFNYFYWSKSELDEALATVPGLGLSQARVDFRHARALGFTHVFIPVFVNQTTATSSDPQVNTLRFGADYLSPSGNLSRLLRLASEEGLVPCIRVFASYGNWGWRGDIAPSDPATWFSNYQAALDQVVDLAVREGVACIEIASEMSSMYTSGLDPLWRGLLEHVRTRMPEAVVFITLNFYDVVGRGITGSPGDPLRSTLEASTLIGVSGYFNLTGPLGTNDLSAALAAWRGGNPYGLDYYGMLVNLSRGYGGKTILFTEVGYRSIDGAGYKPWDYTTNLAKPQDLEEQAVMVEAFLLTYLNLSRVEAAASGYAIWGGEVGLPFKWDGYDVFAKPAADVIARYQNADGPGGTLVFRMPPPPSTVDASLYYAMWMVRSSEYNVQPTFSNVLSFAANLSLQRLPASSTVEAAKLVLSSGGVAVVELETDSQGRLARIAMKTSYDSWAYVSQNVGPYSLPLDPQLTVNLTYNSASGTLIWQVWLGSTLIASRSYSPVPTGLGFDSAYLLDHATPRPLEVGVSEALITMDGRAVMRGSFFYHTGFKEVYTLAFNTAEAVFERK